MLAYRAQTKGKVESGVKYVRRNFLCGLLGKEPSGLDDLNGQMKAWVWTVANQRVHGTTHEQPVMRWEAERAGYSRSANALRIHTADDELRRVARDAYVSWQGSRYSVPWQYAGKDVWVHERAGRIEIDCGAERIAVHEQRRSSPRCDRTLSITAAFRSGRRSSGDKILIHLRETAPVVEARSLAAYESLAAGGVR